MSLYRWSGFVEQGGSRFLSEESNTSPLYVQRSYPGAAVTVYLQGTSTLASIYSDSAGASPKSNPFTSDVYGYAAFYAASGHYSIQFSGGGIITPFNYPDVLIGPLGVSALLTDYASYAVGGDWALAANQALTELSVFGVASVLEIPPGVFNCYGDVLFHEQQTIRSANRNSYVYGGTIQFVGDYRMRSYYRGVRNVRDIHIHDLTILNSNTAIHATAVGIDFSDVQMSFIERVTVRYCNYGLYCTDYLGLGSYYNHVTDFEATSCHYGIVLDSAANCWTIDGAAGRISGCDTAGIYLGNLNTVTVRDITLESNFEAIRVTTGTDRCNLYGLHIEGNTSGGITFYPGAHHNREWGNCASGADGTDKDLIRDLDGRNICESVSMPSWDCGITNQSSGVNLIPNPTMAIDSNGDGIADNWVISSAIPANLVATIDTVVPAALGLPVGTSAQKISVVGATAQRIFSLALAVIPNTRYAFTGLIYTNRAGSFDYGIGTAPGSTNFQHITFQKVNAWKFQRLDFNSAGATVVYLWFRNLDIANVCALWYTGLQLEIGMLPTNFTDGSLTSSGKDTFGAPIASAGAITLTHPCHVITGVAAINTINFPAGYVGPFSLCMSSTATLTAAGNISRAVGAAAGQIINGRFDGTTAWV